MYCISLVFLRFHSLFLLSPTFSSLDVAWFTLACCCCASSPDGFLWVLHFHLYLWSCFLIFLFAYLFSNIPVCLLGPLLFWLRPLENHECLRHHCHQHITKLGRESLLNWLKIWYERFSSDRFPIRSDIMHALAKICILDENQQMKHFKFCQGCHFCSRVWKPFQNVIEFDTYCSLL